MDLEESLNRLSDYSNEGILRELRRVASKLKKSTLTIADIERHARLSYALIKRRFGGIRNALKNAALHSPTFHRNVSDDQLLDELERVWESVLSKEGRRPYKDDLAKYHSAFSQKPYYRRWGSWIRACEALLERSVLPVAKTTTQIPITDKQKTTFGSRGGKRSIPLKLRYEVLKRDSFSCVKCGQSPAKTPGPVTLHVDHKVPESRGGPATMENLCTLCAECNLGKGHTN